MLVKHIEKVTLAAITGGFSAKPAGKSIKKLKELYSKMRHMLWDKEMIEEYVSFTYDKQQKIKDRGKRSSVNYFVAILTNQQNIRAFKDYMKFENKASTPSDNGNTDTVVTYKGREFILLEDIDEGEIYFHEDLEKEKFIFVIRDLSQDLPRLMFLRKFNSRFPARKITRARMIQKARKKV